MVVGYLCRGTHCLENHWAAVGVHVRAGRRGRSGSWTVRYGSRVSGNRWKRELEPHLSGEIKVLKLTSLSGGLLDRLDHIYRTQIQQHICSDWCVLSAGTPLKDKEAHPITELWHRRLNKVFIFNVPWPLSFCCTCRDINNPAVSHLRFWCPSFLACTEYF